ncbi:MAG: hypothetical protein LBR81_08690 [Prevotellaceae bacterium]|jgi:hypothetical protein|nr:hypothetical protein [Prevotellaceae bacterium]
MKKVLFFGFFNFCLISCYFGKQIPVELREELKCYTDSITSISSRININGFYSTKKNTTMYFGFKGEGIDTFFYSYSMFFEDGIYLDNFSLSSINESNANLFYKYQCWGHYIMSGDTIKAKCLAIYPPFSGPPYAYERWYIVLDKNTIKEIFSKSLDRTLGGKQIYFLKNYVNKENPPATFVPMETIPNSDYCWLKKEKWFWCNESDWKEYMKKEKKK